MNTATPNWSARLPHRVRLFKALLISGAALAVMYSGWPWIKNHEAAQVLLAAVLALACWSVWARFRAPAAHDTGAASISRLANGHWRVTTGDRSADGSLQHVWYGWGWVTLRIQPFAPSRTLTVTVWRVNVSARAWHHLRVWTTWELAMVTSPEVRL